MSKAMGKMGSVIDEIRENIVARIRACKKYEANLTKRGVQAGNCHFKTDRPNTMFIYEPTENGRKYIHVGADPNKQEIAIAEIERYRERSDLQREIKQLEYDLHHLDHQVRQARLTAESLLKRSSAVCKSFSG